jgi:hypothetical protein
MKKLRQVMIHLVKQASFLPRFAVMVARRWRRQIVLNEREAERLDRIRNPSKYLGKS